jgi:hypothetical protein
MNVYGCDKYGYDFGKALGEPAVLNVNSCDDPVASGWFAAIFFVSFVVLGGQVLLTLFIGIVSTSMEEQNGEDENENTRKERVGRRCQVLGIKADSPMVVETRNLFDLIGRMKTKVFREDVFQVAYATTGVFYGADAMTRTDLNKLFLVLTTGDEFFNGG